MDQEVLVTDYTISEDGWLLYKGKYLVHFVEGKGWVGYRQEQ